MKGQGKGPLGQCRLKVIDASKYTDYNAKGAIERIAAEQLGAVLYQNTTKAITHFVIAQQSQVADDGDVTALAQRIAHAARVAPNAFIVSQLWVHECARLNQRVPEEHYRVEAENLPVMFKKNLRRCKSTVPAKTDDVNLDLTAPFFSSTQVLQAAADVPMARKQGYKTRRQESGLENMPRQSEPPEFSPATSVSKDDQLSQEHARMLYSDSRPAGHQHTKKNVTFSVEQLPSRRRNTVHGHVSHQHTCSPPSMGRHVDFQLPQNLSPGSAVKARTRNRTPSLDFMLARIGMHLPIIRDEGRALKRNDALFLAAANASRANAPKSDIPVPVVRFIAEDDTGQQSCPTNRPRRRRQAVDTEPADRSGSEDAPVANNPREALAMGVWTEHRVWDHLPPYRPPSVSIGGDQRRSLTEREASPRAAETPAGEVSSGLVVPDSTYPTGAGAHATLRPPSADLQKPSRSAAAQHDSDASAQENIASPIENTAAVDPEQEMGWARLQAGLYSCLAAMGHNTRNRLSALAAVVADSPDNPRHSQPVAPPPDPMPSVAAAERRESSAKAAEPPALSRKRSVAARELGIIDFVTEMGRSLHANATTLSTAVRRTRAESSAPLCACDRAAEQHPPGAGASRPQNSSIEPVLHVHVPRAKRSIRGGSARSNKPRVHDTGDERSRKRLKTSNDEAVAAGGPVSRVAVHDSAEEMESDSDFDMKTTLAVQMRGQNGQVQKPSKSTNGKLPKTPNPKNAEGVMCEMNVQTDELPLVLRAVGLETSSGNMSASKQKKRPVKGRSRVRNVSASTDAELCIACSGVTQDVLDRCKRAVSRLGGATMVDTEEEAMKSKLTHLVVGSNKRSGKLLLALANDAVIVRPDWLVQCIRWRRWLPTEEFLSEFGSPENASYQINQHVQTATDTLLAQHKVHVTSATANAKKDCVRVQLLSKLVTLLGGEQAAACNCDICILVFPAAEAQQCSKQKDTGRTHRQKGACKNQIDIRKLGLPADAVVVADSWLKSTIESRKKLPYTEHYL